MLQLSGAEHFSQPPAEVWACLADANFLSKCLPGLESAERDESGRLVCRVRPGLLFFKGTLKITLDIRDQKPPVPTLACFAPRFVETIETQCAEKPATVSFYKAKVDCLLKHPPLATATLDAIDELLIDAYKQKRSRQTSRRGKPYSVASVNRELATLR